MKAATPEAWFGTNMFLQCKPREKAQQDNLGRQTRMNTKTSAAQGMICALCARCAKMPPYTASRIHCFQSPQFLQRENFGILPKHKCSNKIIPPLEGLWIMRLFPVPAALLLMETVDHTRSVGLIQLLPPDLKLGKMQKTSNTVRRH